ncbi:MAG: hypothetical protein SNH94_05345 [Rikenellaceae bacterium]
MKKIINIVVASWILLALSCVHTDVDVAGSADSDLTQATLDGEWSHTVDIRGDYQFTFKRSYTLNIDLESEKITRTGSTYATQDFEGSIIYDAENQTLAIIKDGSIKVLYLVSSLSSSELILESADGEGGAETLKFTRK